MGSAEFETTQWSVILAVGDKRTDVSRKALASLCERYWPPLYAYVRRRGHGVEEAQDLTQEFFTRSIEHGVVRDVDPDRGLFRSFLLACLKHFLANEWDRATAQKHGGGILHLSLDSTAAEEKALKVCAGELTPEKLFDRRWAYATLDGALARLEAMYSAKGKAEAFGILKEYLTGEPEGQAYKDAAVRLGISEGGVKSAVHRLRKRYQQALRAEVAQTVGKSEDVGEEIRYLISVLSG